MKTFTSLDAYLKEFNLTEDDIFNIKFAQPGIAVVSRLGERTNEPYDGAIYEPPKDTPEFREEIAADYSKGYEIQADEKGNITVFSFYTLKNPDRKKVFAGRAIEKVFFLYVGGLLNYAKEEQEKKDPNQPTIITELPRKKD